MHPNTLFFKALYPSFINRCNKERLTEEDVKTLDEIKEHIKARPNTFFEMEAFLPKKNGYECHYIKNIISQVSGEGHVKELLAVFLF